MSRNDRLNSVMRSFLAFLVEGDAQPPATPDNPPAIVEKQEECDIPGICNKLKEYESAGNEEKVRRVYKDHKGLPTIGHGHLVTRDSQKIFQEVFVDEHKKDPKFGEKVLSGKAELNDAQMGRLLERDVRVRVQEMKGKFKDMHTYSPELQHEMVSEYYRGLLPASKKTAEMINAGDFDGAAKEYLNSKDYREAIKAKATGVTKRIENLSNALRNEAVIRKAKAAVKKHQGT